MRQVSDTLSGAGLSVLAGATILQIVPALEAGGAEQTTIDIAGALAEAGARALVASKGGRLVSELQAKGGLWLPFPAATKNPLAMALNTRRLARLIGVERIDLVHARSRAPAWVAQGAVRPRNTPFVTTYHGSYSGASALKLRYNSVMTRGDAVIANSRYTAELIGRVYPEAAGRVQVIYRGIDLRRFAPQAVAPARVQALRHAWGVAADERIVLLAARLTGWKGHKVLIQAARLMREAGLRGTKFILAGDAQGRTTILKEIDSEIARTNMGDMIARVGHCVDMPAALLAAAVVAVPSTEPEAFGRVAAEAQAMGAPVVVSDLGAMSETVLAPADCDASRRTGWRVPAGEPQALADALKAALDLGASARDSLAARARAHIQSNFSLERMCGETLATYAALLRRDDV